MQTPMAGVGVMSAGQNEEPLALATYVSGQAEPAAAAGVPGTPLIQMVAAGVVGGALSLCVPSHAGGGWHDTVVVRCIAGEGAAATPPACSDAYGGNGKRARLSD